MSFHRQYEIGALTTAEYDFLTSLVEAEMGVPEPRLRPEKLKSRGIWVKGILQIKRFLIWFRELTKETYSFVPMNTIRFWCFQISVSRQVKMYTDLNTEYIFVYDTTILRYYYSILACHNNIIIL